MHLLTMIDRYLRETGMPPSRFGREAMGDPGFVTSLRRGREPRDATVSRVATFMATQREQISARQ